MSYKRFSWDEVRKRNLRISIAKGLITYEELMALLEKYILYFNEIMGGC